MIYSPVHTIYKMQADVGVKLELQLQHRQRKLAQLKMWRQHNRDAWLATQTRYYAAHAAQRREKARQRYWAKRQQQAGAASATTRSHDSHGCISCCDVVGGEVALPDQPFSQLATVKRPSSLLAPEGGEPRVHQR